MSGQAPAPDVLPSRRLNLDLFDSSQPQWARLRRLLGALGFFLLALALTLTARRVGVSVYSPDSWSYHELAVTVFGRDFYAFNTYRSYFSDHYSASFPLGYPVLLALVGQVFGLTPQLGVGVNVVLALLTWPLVVRLAGQLRLAPVTGFTLATTLLLSPFYLDEVYSGRAVPAALLAALLGGSLFLSRALLAGGLCLGVAALIRFDFLIYGLLFVLATLLAGRPDRRWLALPLGLVVGASPWVAYSLTHFGQPWVSDNSWVALSALPAFVVDYPAAPVLSAADAPALWLRRVIGNFIRILLPIRDILSGFPMVPLLGIVFATSLAGLDRRRRLHALILLATILLSTLPYALTRYFDVRYFALICVVVTLLFAYFVERSSQWARARPLYLATVSLALILSMGAGGLALSGLWRRAAQPDLAAQQIRALERCHARTPQATYIFADATLGARYGAVTGRPAAFLASNLGRMTPAQQTAYFRRMTPFVLIEAPQAPEEAETCRPLNQR